MTLNKNQKSAFNMEGRYANALFQLACESNHLDSVAAHVQTLNAMISKTPELQQALKNQSMDKKTLNLAIKNLMIRAKLGDIAQNFVTLVLQKGRGAKLQSMFAAFQKQLSQYKAITHVLIITAIAPSQSQIHKLEQICQNHFGKNSEIKFSIDPTIIAGVKIILPNQALDASLAAKLSQLENRFNYHFQTN